MKKVGSHIVQHDKIGQHTITRQGLKKLIKHMEKNLKEMDKRFGFGKRK